MRRISAEEASSVALVDPTVTLGLLIAALEMQRRTSLVLYHLMRGLATVPLRAPDREGRARVRTARSSIAARKARPHRSSTASFEAPPSPALLSPPALQVRCFGRFEVLRDGAPIAHWRRGKAKLLLKYLVVRRQPVPRDALIEFLWPEADPRIAVNGLRVALHALRQALGSCEPGGRTHHDYVIFDDGNYSLNPAADLWIDADEFVAQFAAGIRLERQGQLAAAIARYEQAEGVYRDDYLIEDLYEDWTLARREELKDQYLMILTKLADACFERGDAEECIVRCHKILQKDACREDAYQRLMRCYARLGQRSQALHWFGVCAQTLRQELDVAPSEQTMALYRAISTGKWIDAAAGLASRGTGDPSLGVSMAHEPR